MGTMLLPTGNLGGTNQYTGAGIGVPTTTPTGAKTGTGATPVPVAVPAMQNPTQNPLVPITPGQVTGAPASTTGMQVNPDIAQTTQSVGGTSENTLDKQLVDIYGKGVGGSLYSLLNNMSGTNSAALQEFINSLAPQEATAQTNLDASLGAAGVGQNSSVAAIGNANLQSQEFGQISQEAENLTLGQEQLTANVLGGMSGAASQETSASGWQVLGQVLQSVGSDAGQAAGAYFGA